MCVRFRSCHYNTFDFYEKLISIFGRTIVFKKRMLKVLKQPFPGYLESTPAITLRYTFYAGLSVFILLFFLRPFGLGKLEVGVLLLHSFYFGLLTFAIASFNSIILPRLFKSFFFEAGWNVSKELLMMFWNLLTITVFNLWAVNFLYGGSMGWSRIVELVAITFSVGIFPVGLSILLKQQVLLKKYYLSAKQIDEGLPTSNIDKNDDKQTNRTITFTGENQGDVISLPVSSILYLEAFQNYIKIHVEEGLSIQTKIIRSTLKVAEETAGSFNELYRCHRAFIINLYKVEHVSGNAQGFKLHIKGIPMPIPVSRNNNREIVTRLNLFRQSL